MPIFCRLIAVLAAVALCAPGSAVGQTSTVPQGGSGVSSQPPVQLGGDDPAPQTSAPQPAGDELPNTGSDPRVLFLAGVALLLFGVGLRLRTADADIY